MSGTVSGSPRWKSAGIRRAMHAPSPRCSSVTDMRHCRSSRLVLEAPRSSRCNAALPPGATRADFTYRVVWLRISSAFGRRCLRSGGVAPRSHAPSMLPRRAWPGRALHRPRYTSQFATRPLGLGRGTPAGRKGRNRCLLPGSTDAGTNCGCSELRAHGIRARPAHGVFGGRVSSGEA